MDRWVAHDERRDVEVTVDVLASLAPSAVRRAAVRAAQVRDVRFARVIASGRETVGDERITYVVSERPVGLSIAEVAGHRIVPPRLASSIIGETARALTVAAAAGVHHGYLRASSITVTSAGRIVVSGLDAEGELATQAGLGRGHSEHSDAVALGRLHLALLTGLDPDAVTAAEVPERLPAPARDLALATVAGTGPHTLAEIVQAAGPADAAALRSLRAAVRGMPHAPSVASPAPPRSTRAPIIGVTHDTLASAEHEAAAAIAAGLAVPEVAQEVRADHVDRAAVLAEQAEDGHVPVPPEVAAQYSKHTRRAAARHADEPLALETWQEITTEQNAEVPPSAAQALLERLERRWPDSAALGTAAESARHRAQRPAPLNSGPVLVGVFLAITVVVAIVALSMLLSPFEPDFDRRNNPPASYPEFTYSPSPSPSVSGDD
ncbi:hypothetical protein [Demequina muriae]|uniref:Protein kinase domain-containing protein n=1 Tax=Demequina muriae TaxID=3051664 RepID=A0ABT8GGC0_9MICO|nr:hypothetical protein [Demequina sp. EGI L300058]MDN4480492.1 hypothetical protein [Demequina sp. EGI L300058]